MRGDQQQGEQGRVLQAGTAVPVAPTVLRCLRSGAPNSNASRSLAVQRGKITFNGKGNIEKSSSTVRITAVQVQGQ